MCGSRTCVGGVGVEVTEHGRRGKGRRRRPKASARQRVGGRTAAFGLGGLGVIGVLVFLAIQATGDGAPAGLPKCAVDCGPTPVGSPLAGPTVEGVVPPRPGIHAGASGGFITPSPGKNGSASPSQSAQPPSHATTLSAAFSVSNSWGSGFIGTLTVSNRGTSAVTLWRLSAQFPSAVITSVWSPSGSVTGAHSGGRLDGIGRGLGPGQSMQVSFQAEGRPTAPAACTLNGHPC
ncbi:cellulose binding domain-containing protein [Actinomadura rupiterrae]|uniref:cellulose binding domain-containing protein n=1 Tax=Actinomadura rupiterrae TaxID=559627 RepID=UPI003558E2AA